MAAFSRAERLFLRAVAAFALVGVNGVFLWALAYRPDAMREAMANPIAQVFMIEALVLVGLVAWMLRKWGMTRLGWGWFVLLSFVGSLAFAIPVALLLPRRESVRTPGS